MIITDSYDILLKEPFTPYQTFSSEHSAESECDFSSPSNLKISLYSINHAKKSDCPKLRWKSNNSREY